MEKLNPWGIEIAFQERERIRLNIISEITGEIRQITLDVDDIAAIHVLKNQRIRKAAEIIDDDMEKSRHLDELMGKLAPWIWGDMIGRKSHGVKEAAPTEERRER